MRKEIATACVGRDEAEALGVIEPFNDASCHYYFLFQLKWACARLRSFEEARNK
jgi:hypothetical protein